MKQIRKRFTYANVMSSIAVFLVLGGATALAATQLAKNSVGSKQLKKNAVTSAKIKKNAVTGAKIKNGAVNGAKVQDGSLTGADINLGTLGTVPSATSAGNASTVNGQSVVSFFKELPTNGAAVAALEFGGVKLTATCPATVPTLTANNISGIKAAARFGAISEAGTATGNGQSLFSTLGVSAGSLGTGNLEVVFENGKVTSVSYGYRDDAFNGSGCRFFGHATTG